MSCGFTRNLTALGTIIWPRFLRMALGSSSYRADRWTGWKHEVAGSVARKHILARSGRCRPRGESTPIEDAAILNRTAEIYLWTVVQSRSHSAVFACGATCSQRWTAIYCGLLVAVSEPASEWAPAVHWATRDYFRHPRRRSAIPLEREHPRPFSRMK